MLLFIYRFFIGYLVIKVTSKNPEKIINLCADKSLNVWDTSLKNDILYFKIGIKSFKLLRVLKRGISAKLHIIKRIGIPFIARRYKKRYGLLAGIFVFFLSIWFMSGFIWNISIVGNENVSREEIINSLKSVGIYEGAKINDIDVKEKRNELLLKDNRLSWAAFNLEGCRITVDVKETKKPEIKEEFPSNLVSGFDGIIKSVEIISGTSAIKVGDAVSKGDLLVSGFLEYDDGSTDTVRSRGTIKAEVKKEFVLEQPIRVTEAVKTGEIENRKVLRIFGFHIPLFIGDVKGKYIKTVQNDNFPDDKPYIPIKLISARYELLEEKTYDLTKDEAKLRLKQNMEKEILSTLGEFKEISREEKIYQNNGNFVLKVKINCIKNIVFEEKILIDTRN